MFVVAAATALFAAAGTVAIAGFWAYLAIFAVVMIVSFAALDPDLCANACGRAARSRRAQRRVKLRQRQVPLVRRSGKPFRGHAADPFASAHIHSVAAKLRVSSFQYIQLVHGTSP